MQPITGQYDPAPSRWSYRFQRLMLTPLFRLILRIAVPFCLALAATLFWLSDQERRDGLILAITDLRASVETRPEFMVGVMAIDGASETVSEDIREILPIDFPISSFDLDLEDIRTRIAGLAPVASVSVRIRPGGVLQIDIGERVPVVLWRTADGLDLLDMTGVAVAEATGRRQHQHLPIIAGQGADQHVAQALQLVKAAAPLGPRLRGLVWMGERRWDVILDRDQRILLPETGAIAALERAKLYRVFPTGLIAGIERGQLHVL